MLLRVGGHKHNTCDHLHIGVTILVVTIGSQEVVSYITPADSSNRCNIRLVLIVIDE